MQQRRSTKQYDEPNLFAGLRELESLELCQKLAEKHNGNAIEIEAEFRKSTLYSAKTARAVIQAGIDGWFQQVVPGK